MCLSADTHGVHTHIIQYEHKQAWVKKVWCIIQLVNSIYFAQF